MESSFSQLLEQSKEQVARQYPRVQLYEADGRPENGQGHNASDVQQWRFIYNNPSTHPNSTVMQNYKHGVFSTPVLINEPWLEDRIIPFPVKMDLSQAVDILHTNHYTDIFSNITLRYQLYPLVNQPHYIFTFPQLMEWVFVGIDDGRVTSAPIRAVEQEAMNIDGMLA